MKEPEYERLSSKFFGLELIKFSFETDLRVVHIDYAVRSPLKKVTNMWRNHIIGYLVHNFRFIQKQAFPK